MNLVPILPTDSLSTSVIEYYIYIDISQIRLVDWNASSLLKFDLLGNGLDDLESTGRVLDYMRP